MTSWSPEAVLRSCLRLLRSLTVLFAAIGCAAGPASAQGFPFGGDEASLGAEEHPKILEQYGGVYDEGELGGYVASVGGRLAPYTQAQTPRFTFTVLDSDVVNAFALPGGYVYVTRGLLALANSEAELAGVVGHEMGHVAARHSTQRSNRGAIASIGSAILGAVLGSPMIGELAGQGAQLYLLRYSRDQEYQADDLGIRYIVQAGYDPYALAGFLAALEAQTRLESRLAGRGEGEGAQEFFSTHPNTAGRVQRAVQEASRTGVREGQGRVGRDEYLRQIDGLIYGDSPEQGYVRGQSFQHPKFRIGFTVPPGFQIRNMAEAVVARGPDGAAVLFDADRAPRGTELETYLTRQWAADVPIGAVESFEVNGMPAITALARASTDDGPRTVRLVAVDAGTGQIFRFMVALPAQPDPALLEALRRMTYSFHRLSAAEAARLRPTRIRIVTVRPGDTTASLARRMAVRDYPEERFLVLNGLRPGAPLSPGVRVKVVTE